MNINRILMDVQPGEVELGNDYWAIPVDVHIEGFDPEDITGIFQATLNDGSTWYFIPMDTGLDGEIYDLLLENEVLGFFSYIDSKSGVQGL